VLARWLRKYAAEDRGSSGRQEASYQTELQVEPDDALGEYNSNLVKIEPRNHLPTPIEVGMQFEDAPDNEHDEEHALILTVTDISDDKVDLDENYPLADIALRFDLNFTEIRVTTEAEIAHQHVHGAHSYDHGPGDQDDDATDDRFYSHPIY